MINKPIIPIFVALSVLITACTHREKFSIEGRIMHPTGDKVLLAEIQGNYAYPIDSVKLGADGRFKFSRTLDQPALYELLAKGVLVEMIARGGASVSIQADASDSTMNYQITGTEENKELQKLVAIRNDAFIRMRRLDGKMEKAHSKADSALVLEESQKILASLHEKTLDFVKKNKREFVAFFGLTYLNIAEDFSAYQDVANAAGKTFKGNPMADSLLLAINRRKTRIGELAPEINLPDVNGQHRKLSSLRGKYVMVDFWASWCGPCREENPSNVLLYERYKNKGFTLYGVSLDKEKADWEAAIKTDKLSWTQVSDLKYWDAEVVKEYDFQAIPYNVLLDPEGKIIAKDLHGAALDLFLANLFK